MEISKGVEIIDLALYIRKEKILVIADLHLGYEEALNKQGLLIPRFQYSEIIKRLNRIMEGVDPETIVINGDLKHEFGTISDQEWRQVLGLIDFFKGKKVVIIKGNHDTIIGPIAQKKHVEILQRLDVSDITILHGDKIQDNLKSMVIIGHEHPAVSFPGRPDERYKCFLKGKLKDRELIVMPSFNLVTAGTDVQNEKLLSPFLQDLNINSFEAFVVEEGKVFDFGKIRNIRNASD